MRHALLHLCDLICITLQVMARSAFRLVRVRHQVADYLYPPLP